MPLPTLRALLEAGHDDAPAFLAPGREALTYSGLRAHVDRTVAELNARGIGRNDRVAIVLPNGPEMASAFVSIGAGATTAPLNPSYKEREFDFYLSDLGAKALVVEEGSTSEAIGVANRLGVRVLEIRAGDERPSGEFEFVGEASEESQPSTGGGPAQADDVALVLHTSGTTSRPKIVPLRQSNVCASADSIAKVLELTPDDRCMNVMPLFHIHGLMAAVLSSLSTGASIFCTPGFNALKFFTWLQESDPTWYTAVPTMHQAILGRAPRNQEIVDAARLRLVRSSSSSLPPQVMADLESVFGAPVIESYGMTEASHQMTSNPLPPRARKPGTVGMAAGPEVSVMDQEGGLLATGAIGEIVIRGPNVTAAYESNPEANASSFTNGWFRTGDQGIMDDEGYLSITGRLKEIINRGGEKISPREVDEVLLDHPAVQQVVTFAMPHEKLGEEVAAAVVLREGVEATEGELRDFAAERLVAYKVPRTVLFLDEIPKGATGKVQRIGLAEKLGLA
ncbi:MAG: AMP-binding protein [Gemmatimonadetes bacterium]|nr:AMP-binding protein [Gemmatimonadota bacterium]